MLPYLNFTWKCLCFENSRRVISKCVLSGANSCSSCLDFFMALYIPWNFGNWSCIHFAVDSHSNGPAACVDTSMRGGNKHPVHECWFTQCHKTMTRFPVALTFQQHELPKLFLPLWQPGAFNIPARSTREKDTTQRNVLSRQQHCEHRVTSLCSILQSLFPLSLTALRICVYYSKGFRQQLLSQAKVNQYSWCVDV